MQQPQPSLKVEIWSDVVCPWCYIGKRRFEAALARFEHRDDVEVVWRSFELDPDAPRLYPGSLDEMLAEKMGGDVERAARMNAHVAALAAEEGLEYRLADARPGNTFDAHRLIHLAAERGLRSEAKERLLRAYFTEGEPIGDRDALVRIAAELGLDADEARAALEGDAFADEVRADERRAREIGASGVPFFVLGGRYAVSGAQPAEVFLEALETAWAEARPLTVVGGATRGAGACGDDGCEI